MGLSATVVVEQRRYADLPADRRAVPRHSSGRAVGIDDGHVRLAGRSSRQDYWFGVVAGIISGRRSRTASRTFMHSSKRLGSS